MSDVKLAAGAGEGPAGRADTAGGAPRPPRRGGAISRHGAISRELIKYSNYKSWADKVRSAWSADSGDEPADPAAGAGRR